MDKNTVKTIRKYKEDWEKLAEEYTILDRDDSFAICRLVLHKPEKPKVIGAEPKQLLVRDSDGNIVEKDKADYNVTIVPAVLVLQAPNETENNKGRIKDGEVYMVSANDVLGEDINPDWREFNAKAIADGHVVRDERPRMLPKLRIRWSQFLFIHPFHTELTQEDKFTFRLHHSMLLNKLNLPENVESN